MRHSLSVDYAQRRAEGYLVSLPAPEGVRQEFVLALAN
jgi:hypothetical protein